MNIESAIPIPAPADEIPPPHHRAVFDGTIGGYYSIWLLNILLTIVTLGAYNFWGKTRLRRYTAASFTLGGDRLEYTGTGGELMRGFAKALPVIILLYLPFVIFPTRTHPITNLMFIPVGFFLYTGIYAAFRYRLSRTLWRGIRGHLGGSAFTFGALKIGLWAVNILSLGVMIPWSDCVAARYQMGNVWIGDRRGVFTGEPKELWRIHFVTLLLAIPTLGASRLWYMAALQRFTYGNFSLGSIRMAADQTGGDIFKLVIPNLLLTFLTFGLGRPIVFWRDFTFIARHLSFFGDLDAEAEQIKQSLAARATSGEGLDGMLDTGLF